MVKVYLDTNIPFKPLQKIDPDAADPEWHDDRVTKSRQLISLIGQSIVSWSTSDIFFKEFQRNTTAKAENRELINSKPASKQFLREVLLQAHRGIRIHSTSELMADAQELADLSKRPHIDPLEYSDAQHIISSFRAQVDKFLTYDHKSILKYHKGYIDTVGRKYIPDFEIVDPVDAGFQDNLE